MICQECDARINGGLTHRFDSQPCPICELRDALRHTQALAACLGEGLWASNSSTNDSRKGAMKNTKCDISVKANTTNHTVELVVGLLPTIHLDLKGARDVLRALEVAIAAIEPDEDCT